MLKGSVLNVLCMFFFFFNDTATTEIYTLSLHDALPISRTLPWGCSTRSEQISATARPRDRKSTRLNSSHGYISYAVFCLKKKKQLPSKIRLGVATRLVSFGIILLHIP